MQECKDCVFRNLNCGGIESDFILEVLIRIRPSTGTYCALFDMSRIEAYRQLCEHLGEPPTGMMGAPKKTRIYRTPDADPSIKE